MKQESRSAGDKSPPSASHSLDNHELAADVTVLAAVGSETRYEILRLVAAMEGDVCVCELEPAVDVGQSAISQALSTLHDADLLTRRKQGRWRYYNTTTLAERLLGVLDTSRSLGERPGLGGRSHE